MKMLSPEVDPKPYKKSGCKPCNRYHFPGFVPDQFLKYPWQNQAYDNGGPKKDSDQVFVRLGHGIPDTTEDASLFRGFIVFHVLHLSITVCPLYLMQILFIERKYFFPSAPGGILAVGGGFRAKKRMPGVVIGFKQIGLVVLV